MQTEKILAPINDLFDQDYNLSYLCESLSKCEENQLKLGNDYVKMSKKLKWYKRRYFYILKCLNLFIQSVTLKRNE